MHLAVVVLLAVVIAVVAAVYVPSPIGWLISAAALIGALIYVLTTHPGRRRSGL